MEESYGYKLCKSRELEEVLEMRYVIVQMKEEIDMKHLIVKVGV